MSKKKLLVCIDWFDPAYKAGGPVRSMVNLSFHLNKVVDIYIYTGDRDLNAIGPLEGIRTDQWNKHPSGANVFYASPQNTGEKFVERLLTELSPDCIYLNSAFSKFFTIDVILAYRKIKSTAKLVLAPRGMLKPSALATKAFKKKLFLALAKISGIPGLIHFHATNETESNEVKAIFKNSSVSVANNFPAAIVDKPAYLDKEPGHIKLILVGRIHPIKNIDFLLSVLKEVQGVVQLDIIGVLEDISYWEQCKELIQSLSETISVRLLGDMPNHFLNEAFSNHHLFVLPTRGENFGHAIVEALCAGRPVLISDQTPWDNLKAFNAGWDCSIESMDAFRVAISEAIAWNQEAFNNSCNGALHYITEKQDNTYLVEQYQQLFN